MLQSPLAFWFRPFNEKCTNIDQKVCINDESKHLLQVLLLFSSYKMPVLFFSVTYVAASYSFEFSKKLFISFEEFKRLIRQTFESANLLNCFAGLIFSSNDHFLLVLHSSEYLDREERV